MALILMLLALALLLGQHWGMMLSNSDDPWIIRSSWAMNLKTASDQGRFWLIPINTMAALPYLGGWEVANVTKILVNGSVLLAFVAFCSRLSSRLTGVLAGVVWLALIDVSPGYYSPFHGFLMMFNLQFAALFLSFYWYLRVIDGPHASRTVVGPYLLFAFALLAYEPMLFYAGVYPALYAYRHFATPTLGWRLQRDGWPLLMSFLRRNWVLPIVVLGYITLYFAYRYFQPTPGRSVDGSGRLVDIALTVFRFSVHGLHVQIKALTNYVPGVSTTENLVLALVYGVSVALAALVLLPRMQGRQAPDRLLRPWSLAVICFYVLCPNFLLALVEAYRRWAAEDPHYVGNYFSSFPLALLVSLGMVSLVGGIKARQEKVLLAMVVVVLATSACDNYLRWSQLAQANRRDSKLWVQAMAQLRALPAAPNGRTQVVCGLHAPEKVSGDERYWSGYLSEYLGRPMEYRYKNLSGVACDVRLEFNDYRYPGARS
ncbi:hypothetical protein [uncultured Rhodoferax sp.]|uniref:hypothetical protein n=1 Tax=uncultured Rhodoferax sp. TaxID=223188 RepID=UPI0025F7C347|nr:hypothetical protein [uncultured Rhodoferax sp.]